MDERILNFWRTLYINTPRAWAMPLVVGINVLVFVAMVATGSSPMGPATQTMIQWGANFGPLTLDHQPWRLITCAFLHFGILHIGFNMWVLWQLGKLVERLLGNVSFLVLYLLSALGGSVASLLWNPMVVSAGASGAVFGVGGGLLGFILLRKDTIPAEVRKQLRDSMLKFLAYNIVFGLAVPGVDVACHVGGLIAGFVCGLIMSQPIGLEMHRRRWQRNLACIVLALLLAPVAMAVLPKSPKQEFDEIGRTEAEIIDRYDAQVKRNRQQQTPDDKKWADELDREVLKPWQKLRSKVDSLANTPLRDRAVMEQFKAYVAVRERGWQTLIEGLRTQNKEKIAEFNQLWNQANGMAARLSKQ